MKRFSQSCSSTIHVFGALLLLVSCERQKSETESWVDPKSTNWRDIESDMEQSGGLIIPKRELKSVMIRAEQGNTDALWKLYGHFDHLGEKDQVEKWTRVGVKHNIQQFYGVLIQDICMANYHQIPINDHPRKKLQLSLCLKIMVESFRNFDRLSKEEQVDHIDSMKHLLDVDVIEIYKH